MEQLEIDGQAGEGGGQIIRTALALSVLLQKPVRIFNVRAKRVKPGLQPQHLAGVQTISKLCKGTVFGASLHSTTLDFFPAPPHSAHVDVHIGTAGSAGLLIQQVAPLGLLVPLQLRVFGGTDVAFSPPASFLSNVWLPLLKSMGCRFELEILSRGYFPAGGGRLVFKSKPAKWPLKPLVLDQAGELVSIRLSAHGRSLPASLYREALLHAQKALSRRFPDIDISAETLAGTGDAALRGFGFDIEGEFESGAKCFGHALSEKNQAVESVVAAALRRFEQSASDRAPVELHVADQVLLFAALAQGTTRFRVASASDHVKTNAKVIGAFLPDCKIDIESAEGSKETRITVQGIGYKGISMESQVGKASETMVPASKNGPKGGSFR